jgi:sugar/nucleoside kinase (ribokinase family)
VNPRAGTAVPLLMVGHLTVDDIVLPDGTTRMQQVGGAPVFAATGALLAGARPRVVTALAPSLPARVRDWLAAEEIELLDCGRASRHITQWVVYEATGERTFLHHPGSADLYEAAPLAECWRPARPVSWAHIAPMPVTLQAAWVRALTGAGLSVTLDPHEDCSAERRDAVLELLPRLTAFMPSEQEAASLFGGADMTAAAAAFVAAGAGLCVIKLGAADCVDRATDRGVRGGEGGRAPADRGQHHQERRPRRDGRGRRGRRRVRPREDPRRGGALRRGRRAVVRLGDDGAARPARPGQQGARGRLVDVRPDGDVHRARRRPALIRGPVRGEHRPPRTPRCERPRGSGTSFRPSAV